ncbi:hypothetical protein P6U16_13450 [Rhizobium sp. 32-5/1]|uniref:hypothetical protein n=1 Tax=Rhizobium sp. 32-5/1 TaxID=3019602 RepID=UPI00240E3115|nr:hypothetical protein [Rhizobium sp. 32-5/1]WEZ82182.1 hypothetical protein P6U16_13450 [Rhizobium sp. 32-5/1]
MFDMTIELMANGLSLVNSLVDSAKHGIAGRERVKIEKVIEALHSLFFFEDRTRDLIVRLANGEEVEREAIDRALKGFEQSEDPVAEALLVVDAAATQRPSFLTLDALDKLRTLRRHKGNVRDYIELILLDLAGPSDESMSAEQRRYEAGQLLQKIDDINARLNAVDRSIRGQ